MKCKEIKMLKVTLTESHANESSNLISALVEVQLPPHYGHLHECNKCEKYAICTLALSVNV